MAIITCPECGKEISNTCASCVHCGYLLRAVTTSSSEAPAKPKKLNNNKSILKYIMAVVAIMIPIFITLFTVVVLLIVGVSIYFANANKDPFKDLYEYQTRESVRNEYGTPDDISNEDPNKKYSWNIDEYYDVKFLGKSGTLSVWYDEDNLVSHAFFVYEIPYKYNYDDSEEGSLTKERNEVREYVHDIIEYYTKKYGTPDKSGGIYDYEWSLMDGSYVTLKFDLDPDNLEVRLYWS